MEGPLIRSFPRIELDYPVELLIGDRVIQLRRAMGNLSAGGLFARGEGLPVGTPVQIKIAAAYPFQAEGVVRHYLKNGDGGVGIQFTTISAAVGLLSGHSAGRKSTQGETQ